MNAGKRSLITGILISVLFCGASQGKMIFVAGSGDNTTGEDWGTAFTSLQGALDAAGTGDTIHVAGETLLTDAQISWTVSGVSILGGYAGNATGGLPGERDPAQWPTIIQRDGTAIHRILLADGVVDGLLEGVTLRNGETDETAAGAGLKIASCSNLVVRSCIVEANRAYNTAKNLGNLMGGGLYASDSHVDFSNTVFRANISQTVYSSTYSHALGGGAAILGGAVQLIDCLWADNRLIAARNAYGSGLYIEGGSHRVEHGVFMGNTSPLSQGGLSYNRGDGLHVGGASTVVSVCNTLFSANLRDGIHLENGSLAITNATIVGHGRYGVRRVGGSLTIANSILWQNDINTEGTVALNNCQTGVDPLFERGLYLSAGSPAIDAGMETVPVPSITGRTTAVAGTADTGTVDLGYHFRPAAPFGAADEAVRHDPAFAALYVAPDGSDGNPGTAAQPFRSITRAVGAAVPGSHIQIAAGLYTNGVETFPILLDKPGLRLIGAGAPDTIVNAGGAATGKRVLQARGVTGDGALSGLTLTGAIIPKSPIETFLAFDHENYERLRLGGGLHTVNSSLMIDGVAITNNTLVGAMNEDPLGGGVYGLYSWVTLTNSLIADNSITSGQSNTGAGYGGGLYLRGGFWQILDGRILNNRSDFANNSGSYAGGIAMVGYHEIVDSIIAGNRVSGQAGSVRCGGGIYMTGGLVDRCLIASNTMIYTASDTAHGGGIYMTGGTTRNCLITANQAERDGGAVYATGGLIESVTAAGNRSVQAGTVAGIYLSGVAPLVSNSVSYANDRIIDHLDVSVSEAGGAVAYSCSLPTREGIGNTDADPEFVDAEAGNYRLLPGSPAIDSAVEQGWMSGATDFEGNPRVRNAVPDQGAFEAEPPNTGPLRANFIADQRQGIDNLAVTLTAYVSGSDTNGLVYAWDFDNNGSIDASGADKRVVTQPYTPGIYAVRLVVVNGASESTEWVKEAYLRVSSSAIYVWSGGDNSVGTSWATAFTNLQEAIDFASVSNTIYLAGETFNLGAELVWSGHEGVQILGGYAAGADTVGPGPFDPEFWPTVVRRASGTSRVLSMAGLSGCRLASVTIANGNTPVDAVKAFGGGIYILLSDIVIEDCVISNNQANASGNGYVWGGGVYALDSTVTLRRTLFTGNVAKSTPGTNNNRAHGGGLASENSTIRIFECRFIGNDADAQGYRGSWGGAIYLLGGTGLIRNSLLADNRAGPITARGQGGGIYLNPGTVLENCTVAGNQCNGNQALIATSAAGIYDAGGLATNTIIYYNTNTYTGAAADVYTEAPSRFGYSCAPELTNAEAGNLTAVPRFANSSAGDYSLLPESPCRNAGLKQPWMETAVDLAGNKRIAAGGVDIGAFEVMPPGGTLLLLK